MIFVLSIKWVQESMNTVNDYIPPPQDSVPDPSKTSDYTKQVRLDN